MTTYTAIVNVPYAALEKSDTGLGKLLVDAGSKPGVTISMLPRHTLEEMEYRIDGPSDSVSELVAKLLEITREHYGH